MSATLKFIKFTCVYIVCTIVLLDIYFLLLKPYIIQKFQPLESGYWSDINGVKPEPVKEKRCGTSEDSSRTHSCSKYYYLRHLNDGVPLHSQSLTRKFKQSVINFVFFAWDRLFIFFEEVEYVTRILYQLVFSFENEHSDDQHHSTQKNEPSALSKHVDQKFLQSYSEAKEKKQMHFALSATIQKNILQKNVKIHASSQEDTFINTTIINMAKMLQISIDLRREANNTLKVAKEFLRVGNLNKAKKLLEHARALDPLNAEVIAAYGEVFERRRPPDYVQAEHYYGKALLADPGNERVRASRRRTLPLVEQIDQARFNRIDHKVYQYYHIPEGHPGLRRLKKEHYFRYVYHSNAIEGNTLSLAQTRAILETRIAVGGKSVLEHNEVLGLDAALKFLNSSLLRKAGPFAMSDILEIHRRVLGFVDLQEAGRLRETQVFIADFQPPPASLLPALMAEFLTWLNAEDTQDLHPVELAALAHWKFVYIHPFYDGNGRTARLLMNLILMRAGYPPAIVRVEERALYYQLIREANEGDVRPFIRFIAHCTEATIDEFILTAKNVINFEGSLSEPLDGAAKPRVINL